jgi:hypothetical protein
VRRGSGSADELPADGPPVELGRWVAELRLARDEVVASIGPEQENTKGKWFCFLQKGFNQLNSNINLNSTKQK